MSIKIGENGPEGKCAICGKYVIKDGVLFREKSVLCIDCKEFQSSAKYIEEKGKK
ncbi:MAG: hypothetical protein P8J51_03940 [Dehalococcoidia bacterium]|nr:hypothetical protein [Dehalococcoidia bacterium]